MMHAVSMATRTPRNPSLAGGHAHRGRGQRARLLDFFDADPEEYEVVFTPERERRAQAGGRGVPVRAGLAASCSHRGQPQLGERGPGVRGAHGAPSQVRAARPRAARGRARARTWRGDRGRPNLFAYPAQSNFSGVRIRSGWVEEARALGYDVFLDAAAFAPTSRARPAGGAGRLRLHLLLQDVRLPDRRGGAHRAQSEALEEAAPPLVRGGTVRFVSAQNEVFMPAHGTGRGFEDGTLNFLGIAAVPAGARLPGGRSGWSASAPRVRELTARAPRRSSEGLRHPNGEPMPCASTARARLEMRGGAVAFNLLDPDGRAVPYGRGRAWPRAPRASRSAAAASATREPPSARSSCRPAPCSSASRRSSRASSA
jgi:selenocysteine lyase/cysteine desulfurase